MEALAALRRVRKRLDRERGELERLIREAHAAGSSYRQIAEAAGMSHEHVRRLVAVQGGENRERT